MLGERGFNAHVNARTAAHRGVGAHWRARVAPRLGATRGLFLRAVASLCALGALLALATLSPAGALAGEGCSNEALREAQTSTFLPDCRAYEQVSPVDKNGGDVMPYSPRTRAAADGEAVSFASLLGFGDVQGTGSAVEYMAARDVGHGWATHAITPQVPGNSFKFLLAGGDTFYEGAFSANLERGILASAVPVTGDPNVSGVGNLYLRDDLLSAGAGKYDLVSVCSLCEEEHVALSPLSGPQFAFQLFLPHLAGSSPDLSRVAFESVERLTKEAPAQSALCGTTHFFFPPPSPVFCAARLYEWEDGVVRLAGVLPDGTPADMSFAGYGAREAPTASYTPHVVSDGSDGHSRVFFTQPTNEKGETASQLGPFGVLQMFAVHTGNLFMRVDHSSTVQLNVSERTEGEAGEFAPAQYLDASADGERVFFMTSQMLTNDAQSGGAKIYMYDARADAGHRLTMLSPPGADSDGLAGVSDDGHYVYMMTDGEFILWHNGTTETIGPVPEAIKVWDLTDGVNYEQQQLRESRVTPDGRYFVFVTDHGANIGGYDHGNCNGPGIGCHEVYVYSADSNTVTCASCNPTGATATANASDVAAEFHGGARTTTYQNRVISDNGELVFFSTAEALVSQDTNGKSDAYVFNTRTGKVSLLSSGTDPSGSYFVDTSASGNDAFIVTRQKLVGWDDDESYDLYDVRVGGGLPEPPPLRPACVEEACQGSPPSASATGSPASLSFTGSGNSSAAVVRRLTNAQKLSRALRLCHSVRGKRQRKRCEARARRRYGAHGASKRGVR
jgi:hypothetical protein